MREITEALFALRDEKYRAFHATLMPGVAWERVIGVRMPALRRYAAALAKTLGQVWQAHPAQGLYAITADADFEQHFGKKAARRRKIYNGMIPCQLYMYFEQPKRERK